MKRLRNSPLALRLVSLSWLLTLSMIELMSRPAAALVELRGSLSRHDITNTSWNSSNGFPKLDNVQSVAVDVMASVPMMPVGLGLRYETLKRTETGAVSSTSVDWRRTSIIINKRLLDDGLYFGPIGTIGFASDFQFRQAVAASAVDYKTEAVPTYTAGLEAGFQFLIFTLGAELGYMHAPLGELRFAQSGTPAELNGARVNVDMSGPYYRITGGVKF